MTFLETTSFSTTEFKLNFTPEKKLKNVVCPSLFNQSWRIVELKSTGMSEVDKIESN